MFVIARNTAFTFKGKPTDVKAIGKDLAIKYVLEGSVQPTATRIRVNAQLVDAETGTHLWAESFDEDRADLLQMEDDIARPLPGSSSQSLFAEFKEFWVLHRVPGVGIVDEASTALQRQVLRAEIAGAQSAPPQPPRRRRPS